MLRIVYESEDFPTGTVATGLAELPVTWDELLWAAVTVGRPNRHYVFKHGVASQYEALFRWSMMRMALEQSGPRGLRLRRTEAAKTLDPTEKGAVNYFLGMVICKLFASKLLDTPWLLHLDVFRPLVNPFLTGRSRPDLVGEDASGKSWYAFECKGRVSPPDAKVKAKAKSQAQRLVSVNGSACALHVGAVTYFKGDALQFYWRDPPADSRKGIDVRLGSDAWRHYYEPVLQVASNTGLADENARPDALIDVEGADIKVGIHPAVSNHLARQEWAKARSAAAEAQDDLAHDGFHRDGLKVVAGRSWSVPYADPGGEEG